MTSLDMNCSCFGKFGPDSTIEEGRFEFQMIQGNGIPKLGYWEGQTQFISVLEFRLLAGDRISGLPLFKNLMNTQKKVCQNASSLLCIAAGTGIAPFVRLIESLLDDGDCEMRSSLFPFPFGTQSFQDPVNLLCSKGGRRPLQGSARQLDKVLELLRGLCYFL